MRIELGDVKRSGLQTSALGCLAKAREENWQIAREREEDWKFYLHFFLGEELSFTTHIDHRVTFPKQRTSGCWISIGWFANEVPAEAALEKQDLVDQFYHELCLANSIESPFLFT